MTSTNPQLTRAIASIDRFRQTAKEAAAKDAAKKASITATDPNNKGTVSQPVDPSEVNALMPGGSRPSSQNSGNIATPNRDKTTTSTDGTSVPTREYTDGSVANTGLKSAAQAGQIMERALKIAAETSKEKPKEETEEAPKAPEEEPKSASDEVSYSYGKLAYVARIMTETTEGREAMAKALVAKKANLQLDDIIKSASVVNDYTEEVAVKRAFAEEIQAQQLAEIKRASVRWAKLPLAERTEETLRMAALNEASQGMSHEEIDWMNQGALAMKRALDETAEGAAAEDIPLDEIPSEDIGTQAPTIDEVVAAVTLLAEAGIIPPDVAQAIIAQQAGETAGAPVEDLPPEAVAAAEDALIAEAAAELPPEEELGKAASAVVKSASALLQATA